MLRAMFQITSPLCLRHTCRRCRRHAAFFRRFQNTYDASLRRYATYAAADAAAAAAAASSL